MKELAKHIVRAGLPVKRTKPRSLAEIAAESTQESVEDLPQNSVYRTPDSWETRNRLETLTKTVEEEEAKAKARGTAKRVEEEPEIHRGKRMSPKKRRRSALSVCVSDEEAELLRRYAASKDMGFSEWARGVMFRAMGRKPPARPRQE